MAGRRYLAKHPGCPPAGGADCRRQGAQPQSTGLAGAVLARRPRPSGTRIELRVTARSARFPAPGGHDTRFPRYWAGGAGMAVIPETAPAPASGAPRWRRFLTRWRSPADQPAWARPALLAIAAVAAVAYGWGMAGASVEPFYGAAARSTTAWNERPSAATVISCGTGPEFIASIRAPARRARSSP